MRSCSPATRSLIAAERATRRWPRSAGSLLGLPEQPEPAGEFDFVVTGGGIAGTCAAVSAARLGLKVALVQDRPVLGGNNSSEVRVWLQGARNKEPWPRIGDVVAELEQDRRAHYGPANTADLYEDEKKLAVVRAETEHHACSSSIASTRVETDGGRIRAVIAQDINSGRRLRIGGRWFADCTGDAAVGALAGADFEMKPKGHMGPCNLWNVCECKDTNAINTAVAEVSQPRALPALPVGARPDRQAVPRPQQSRSPIRCKLGGWYWESGFDRDPINEMEYIRDWNFRAMYGAWDALKNVDKVLPNHRLNWAAYILGKRESRRLMGDVVLTAEDLESGPPVSRRLRADRLEQSTCTCPTRAMRRASRATPSSRSADIRRSLSRAGRSGFPTAASTRATSPTSSWPAATSASRTRRSARCG